MVAIQILEQVVNGLLAGAYYLLIALGLSLIFSLGGLVNLAHGAFYALGAYFAVKLADHIGYAGAFIASPIAVALIGLVIEDLFAASIARIRPWACVDVRPRDGGRAGAAGFSVRRRFRSPFRQRSRARYWSVSSFIRAIGSHARGRGRRGRRTLVSAAAYAVRSRRARGRAKPRHGCSARHLPHTTWRAWSAPSVSPRSPAC
jgi:hypothetical protein